MFSRKLDAQEYHHRAPTNVIRRIPHPLQSCRRTTTDILEFVVRNRDKLLLCTAGGVTIPRQEIKLTTKDPLRGP